MLMYMKGFINSVEANTLVDAIYLDFSKAFEMDSHKHLIEKLKSMEINESIVAWTEN